MRALGLGLLLCVTGCRPEPDFEERFSQAENRIAERANALDTELNTSSDTAAAAEDTDAR